MIEMSFEMAAGESSDENYDDILPEARIFESRIDEILNTKMEAYEELFKKEKEEIESDDDVTNDLAQKAVEYQKNKKNQPKNKGRKNRKACKLLPEKESPPPIKPRRSPRKKFLEDVPEDIQKPNKDVVSTDSLLPASARKRLKKLQFETEREKKRIDAETQRILFSCDASKNSEADDVQLIDDTLIEQEIILRIRFLSKIAKITVRLGEVFKSIFEKVADLFKLKSTEILLCLGDRNIEYSDTPIGLKLKFFDIIDCIPYKSDERKEDDKSNKLLLKIQSNDSRKKIELHIHKLQKFEEIMKRYADLRKLSVENLEFEFDGEKIEGTETPTDLDMESGSCIDVRVLNYQEIISEKPKVFEIENEIAPEDMLDVCVLD